MFETIVVPIDGSDHAERAARRGFEIAAHHDSSVHILCVVDTGPLGGYQLPGESESAEKAIEERAKALVTEVTENAPNGIDITTATPVGSAKNEIVSYTDSVGADLVVMGSRGRGGVERLMLGSVTEHVVRTSDVDVLVCGED
jgi:nucleotide-binding universal stress UspA family protein